MAASLEDVGKGPGGDTLRSYLGVSHNDDGSIRSFGHTVSPSGDTSGATDTAAINAALAAALVDGAPVDLAAGTFYLSNEIVIPGPNFVLRGAGKNATILKRNSNAYGTVIRNDTRDGTLLEHFAIDGGLSGFPTNANNGIRIFDSNNVTCRNIKITNYQQNAILSFVTTPNTKSNIVYDSCECDGTGGANNGFLIVDTDEAIIRHCRAANLSGGSGPNYGLQLKNQCRYGAIEDGYANNCVGGFAFGNDTSTSPSVSKCRITGGIALNCNSGFIGSYDDHNEVEGLVIIQQAGNNEAIRLQGNSNNNVFTGTMVSGTPSPKGIVRFDDTSFANFVEVNNVDSSTAGALGQFEGTTSNNQVIVRRVGSNRPALDKGGAGTGTQNQVWVHSKPQDQIRLAFGENMLAENFQREIGAGASALTQGTGYFMRIPLRAGTVVTNILFLVSGAAVGMTLSKVGLYKKDGTQLAVSADQTTSWQTTGIKTNLLTAPYTVPTDDVYFACILAVGTTGPTVIRGGATGTQNTASSGGVMPYGAQAGLADLPSPATIVTTNGVASWIGVT